MRKDLLNLLRCPNCFSKNLMLTIKVVDIHEVKEGHIYCEGCHSTFPILNGVIELLSGLDVNTLKERNARHKQRDWSVEQQRPFINDNTAQPWLWPAFAANVKQGLDLIEPKGKTVLDIGAATCWATRMMCERGATAVAIDISTSMLIDGEAQFSKGVYFERVTANMVVLPFRDKSVHAIFFSASIHHTSNLKQVIKECTRCITDDGSFILVNEPVSGYLRNNQSFGEIDLSAGMNEHIYSLNEYQDAVRSAGLETKIFFPDSLRNQLIGKAPCPPTIGIKALKALWPIMKSSADKIIYPMHWIFGGELVMMATKQKNSSIGLL
jgi:SAM-dependent methyltransferase